MAQRVVDVFEMVQVKEQERYRLRARVRPQKRIQLVLQLPSVGQSGQYIMGSRMSGAVPVGVLRDHLAENRRGCPEHLALLNREVLLGGARLVSERHGSNGLAARLDRLHNSTDWTLAITRAQNFVAPHDFAKAIVRPGQRRRQFLDGSLKHG